jgi:hypothetical protein
MALDVRVDDLRSRELAVADRVGELDRGAGRDQCGQTSLITVDTKRS